MYRPEIKVIDCTIRDGGLTNDSQFPPEMVRNVFKALNASGVDIIELGYRNSREHFSPDQYGLWRFCDDEVLKKVMDGVELKSQIAIMMDAHKSNPDDLKPKAESPVDIVRVATYVKDIDRAIFINKTAQDLGYKTTLNIMAMSHTIEWELDEALQQIEKETNALAVYIVDSFGAMYSEDVDFYYDKYRKFIKNKEVGIHCHNNQQLGFANTIQGIIRGANYLDGTLYGIGRGAGNCPLEVLMSFLKNPKFDIRPVLDVIGKEILPLMEKLDWGYRIPYMVTGVMNMHPEEAIKLMSLDKNNPMRNDFLAFHEKCADLG